MDAGKKMWATCAETVLALCKRPVFLLQAAALSAILLLALGLGLGRIDLEAGQGWALILCVVASPFVKWPTLFVLRMLNRWSCRAPAAAGRRVLIVGAGEAGTLVAHEMKATQQLNMEPVAFVDDDPAKIGTYVQGLPVLGNCAQIAELAAHNRIEQIVVAIPSAPLPRQKELVAQCTATGIATYSLPGIYQLLAGYKTVSPVPEVDTQQLLHRPPIRIDQSDVSAYLRGATVLVTGAGGSIGSELCRQIARFEPDKLILLGHGENSIFEINLNLRLAHPDLATCPVIVDVRDRERVSKVVKDHRPDVIFHAAAHKHVPLMENAVGEAIANNALGTRNVLHAAERHGVQRFVLISSDKAVHPTTVMGATKRLAELLVQATARRSGYAYTAVRFGNVLGSRGSVIPIFQRQIAAGGPITVTHPDMRRYFMTIPEAVQLVLGAAGMAHGGEIFVLDMGEPVRIVDLAGDLIKMAGLQLGRDIEIVYSGIRPGEKLDEELFLEQEQCRYTPCERIFCVTSDQAIRLETLERLIADLVDLAQNQQGEAANEQVRTLLLDICHHTERYLPVLDLPVKERKMLAPREPTAVPSTLALAGAAS